VEERRPMSYMIQQYQAMRQMWAAKLLLHAKDYALGVRAMNGKRYDPKGGLYVSDARRAHMWFFDDADVGPGSFIWVCDLFELDPERTRNKVIHRWRELLNLDDKDKRKKEKARAARYDEESDDE
jgi:hypothetical protein